MKRLELKSHIEAFLNTGGVIQRLPARTERRSQPRSSINHQEAFYRGWIAEIRPQTR